MEKEIIPNNKHKIESLTLSQSNKKFFLMTLENLLKYKFGSVYHENYGRDVTWGLLSLIDNDILDNYILIYVDDLFWGGSGGIIRNYNNETIYQCAFRLFTHNTRDIEKSIGSTSYIHSINTKKQIERAKSLNCKKAIMSFNEYNLKLYKITKLYHLPKIFKNNEWTSDDKLVHFNGVNQWILTYSI